MESDLDLIIREMGALAAGGDLRTNALLHFRAAGEKVGYSRWFLTEKWNKLSPSDKGRVRASYSAGREAQGEAQGGVLARGLAASPLSVAEETLYESCSETLKELGAYGWRGDLEQQEARELQEARKRRQAACEQQEARCKVEILKAHNAAWIEHHLAKKANSERGA